MYTSSFNTEFLRLLLSEIFQTTLSKWRKTAILKIHAYFPNHPMLTLFFKICILSLFQILEDYGLGVVRSFLQHEITTMKSSTATALPSRDAPSSSSHTNKRGRPRGTSKRARGSSSKRARGTSIPRRRLTPVPFHHQQTIAASTFTFSSQQNNFNKRTVSSQEEFIVISSESEEDSDLTYGYSNGQFEEPSTSSFHLTQAVIPPTLVSSNLPSGSQSTSRQGLPLSAFPGASHQVSSGYHSAPHTHQSQSPVSISGRATFQAPDVKCADIPNTTLANGIEDVRDICEDLIPGHGAFLSNFVLNYIKQQSQVNQLISQQNGSP